MAFSTNSPSIEGVREDVTDIILNEALARANHAEGPKRMRLQATSSRWEVTAAQD